MVLVVPEVVLLVSVALVELVAVALVAVALVAVALVAVAVELSPPSEVLPPLPPAALPSLVVVPLVPAPPLLVSFDELSPVVSPGAPPVPTLVVPPDVLDELALVVLAAVEAVLPGPVFDVACVVLEVVFVVFVLLARSFPSLDIFSSTALAQLASTIATDVPKNSTSLTFTEVSQITKLLEA